MMRKNPFNFNYDILSNDQMLLECVKANVSVFLHGPSGVGKSTRVRQLDPTATFITLRPQMNPEEIDGVLNRETGEYIAPLWYTQLVKKCNEEPNRIHILFIDELTNVKPTVQSLVYPIVLDRTGKDGLWPLPKNSIVIGAGNEVADVSAAYPMPSALFRRFCHIYYKVSKEEFLNWATGTDDLENTEVISLNNSKTPISRLHPAILAYISSREEDILYSEYNEDEPNIVVDTRKWEIASKLLYSSKNPQALRVALGEDITADFVSFVQELPVSINDVMNDNYNAKEIRALDFGKKLATALALTTANEQQIRKVRDFIKECLNSEILAQFEIIWIGRSEERALMIAELMEEEGAVDVE